jgi:hypothetical protein
MGARFRHRHDAGSDRVKINVRANRQKSRFIEDRHALKPSLEKRPLCFVLSIGQSRQRLLQAFHEPTETLQSLAQRLDLPAILEAPLHPVVSHRERLACLIPRRKKLSPTSHDFLIGPAVGDVRVKAQEQETIGVSSFFGGKNELTPILPRQFFQTPILPREHLRRHQHHG